MKAAVLSVAALLALTVAAPAQTVVTQDDCRAEFQANLHIQGGYASERDARAQRAGTAEAIYNACLAHARGQAGYMTEIARKAVVTATYRRGPQPACGLILVGGNGYACNAARFGN